MAGAHHLHRLLGPRLAVRRPSQSRHRRDHAPAGDAGRARAAEGVGQERARPCDPELHERAGARIRLMSATTRSIRSNRRRRSTFWSARASRPARRRGRIWGLRRRGEQRRLPPQTLLFLQRRRPVRAQTPAFPGLRTKREHFLDRLRRSWHSQLQWEKWRRRSSPALPNFSRHCPRWPERPLPHSAASGQFVNLERRRSRERLPTQIQQRRARRGVNLLKAWRRPILIRESKLK